LSGLKHLQGGKAVEYPAFLAQLAPLENNAQD
jgi:hypothetical protein